MNELTSDFIDCLIKVEEFKLTIDDIYSFLKAVVSGNTAFICLVLLCHGKGRISVKDNLELDSTEIKLIQRFFIDSDDILSLLEQLFFLITCVHTSEQSDSFVKQRLNLLFPREMVTTNTEITFWAYQRYICSDKEARRLKYLAVYLIDSWISSSGLIQKALAFATKANASHAH